MEVGILGLDTSHAESFADRIAERETVSISHVWDTGTIRPRAYARSYCDRTDSTLVSDPASMIDAVDAAMVLTVDWNTHADLAIPFLEADVPIFVDKPIAGQLDAVRRLLEVAGETPLLGGSAVPFSPRLEHLPRGESDRTIFGAGYNDHFYYRVHLSDTVRYLTAADWQSVDVVDGPGTTVRITFENGTTSTIRYDGADEDGIFGFLDVGQTTRTADVPGREDVLAALYDGCLDTFFELVRNEHHDTDWVGDAARLAIAVETALDEQGRITPASDSFEDFSLEADSFTADYEPYY